MSGAPRITDRLVLFDGTSAQSSTFTSNSFLVADYTQLTISVQTSDAAASRMTVESSSEDGLRTSLTTWSNITVVTEPGIYTVDSGLRWLRAVRSSLDSLGEVTVQGKY